MWRTYYEMTGGIFREPMSIIINAVIRGVQHVNY